MSLVAAAQGAIAGLSGISLVEERGGPVLRVATPASTCAIALQGAHVVSWTPAHATHDVLWCSDLSPWGGGAAIRGGIPVCWPWFGPHPTNATLPQHGMARNHQWHLVGADVSPATVALRLRFGASDGAPPGLAVELLVEVGTQLALTLTTHNHGHAPMPLSAALHPYFDVSDIGTITVDGLDGASYRDLADNGTLNVQSGPIRFASGRTQRFDQAPAVQTIDDPGYNRRIRIERTTGASAIVWHPGEAAARMADIPAARAHQFVCVESGDVGAASIVLAPGSSHTVAVRYTVEALR